MASLPNSRISAAFRNDLPFGFLFRAGIGLGGSAMWQKQTSGCTSKTRSESAGPMLRSTSAIFGAIAKAWRVRPAPVSRLLRLLAALWSRTSSTWRMGGGKTHTPRRPRRALACRSHSRVHGARSPSPMGMSTAMTLRYGEAVSKSAKCSKTPGACREPFSVSMTASQPPLQPSTPAIATALPRLWVQVEDHLRQRQISPEGDFAQGPNHEISRQ